MLGAAMLAEIASRGTRQSCIVPLRLSQPAANLPHCPKVVILSSGVFSTLGLLLSLLFCPPHRGLRGIVNQMAGQAWQPSPVLDVVAVRSSCVLCLIRVVPRVLWCCVGQVGWKVSCELAWHLDRAVEATQAWRYCARDSVFRIVCACTRVLLPLSAYAQELPTQV